MNSNIIERYEELGGLLKGHFLLSSGLHSDKYLQSEKVLMYPDIACEIVAPLAEKLSGLEFDSVVSPAIGGIRFGYELARQVHKKSMFTERVDGVMTFRRGFALEKGEKVVVAEDVVTTGKSTKECIKAIIDAGGVVAAVVSIIDRSGGSADFGVPYISLAKIDVQSWTEEECLLCKSGSLPVKPGSREFKK